MAIVVEVDTVGELRQFLVSLVDGEPGERFGQRARVRRDALDDRKARNPPENF